MSEETNQKETNEAPKKEQKHREHHECNWANKVFWGLLLILIGGLALVGNFGLATIEWSNLWRLWPLFIVAAGLSILSFKNIIWKIISVILSVVAVAAIAWVLLGGFKQIGVSIDTLKNYNETIQIASGEIKSAEVSLDAGASEVYISTADQIGIATAGLTSNFATLEKTSSVSGSIQKVDFSMKTENKWFNNWVGSYRNKWDIKLTRNLPLSLNVNAGACDADIDLSDAKLNMVDIDMGASDLTLKLGKNQSLANVTIDSGASSILVRVPTESGVKLVTEGGLSSKELADLKLSSDKTYESNNYDSAISKINITAKIGVSSFTIERY
jgi:cytochrome c oxidase subunit IV